MGLDIDSGKRLETEMEFSTYKPNGIFAKELEDELMKFTTNYEDCKVNTHLVEQNEVVHGNADVEVNITECTKSGCQELVETDYHDTTESSSSFGNSDSEIEKVDPSGDSEVASDFRHDVASSLDFDGFGEPLRMRKKKLTPHWRSFIQPLMWRCKWAELQIRKFQSQAKKYDRELQEYSQQKQVRLQNSTLEGLGVKSLPYAYDSRSEVHRRKKRKRTEATTDTAAYMSQHNIFSYYENRRCFAGGSFKDDELKYQAIATQKVDIDDQLWVNDDEYSYLEPGDGDDSLEHALTKIELLKSQVVKMKSKVDKVLSEDAGMFSFIEDSDFPMPFNVLIGSPQNIASPSNNGDRMPVGTCIASQLKLEHNMGGVLVAGSTVTSYGDVVPDVNGSTNHIPFADAYKKGEDDVLINNQRVKEEMYSLEEVKIQPVRRPLKKEKGSGSTATQVLTEVDLPMDDQPPPKIRSMSKLTATKTQRKKGRRKGAGWRGRRSTG